MRKVFFRSRSNLYCMVSAIEKNAVARVTVIQNTVISNSFSEYVFREALLFSIGNCFYYSGPVHLAAHH